MSIAPLFWPLVGCVAMPVTDKLIFVFETVAVAVSVHPFAPVVVTL